jgi:hypothetical protein
LKWIKKYTGFKKYKSKKTKIKSTKGYDFIYKTLKKFLLKNVKLNWYDLRSESVYEEVKDYFENKLGNL